MTWYSSIIDKNNSNKKYLTTLLYGSIAYIITHAYLSSSSSKVIEKIKDYFWLIVLLDIGSMGYLYTQEDNSDNKVDWFESINQLKNEISKYTIGKNNNNENENNDDDDDNKNHLLDMMPLNMPVINENNNEYEIENFQNIDNEENDEVDIFPLNIDIDIDKKRVNQLNVIENNKNNFNNSLIPNLESKNNSLIDNIPRVEPQIYNPNLIDNTIKKSNSSKSNSSKYNSSKSTPLSVLPTSNIKYTKNTKNTKNIMNMEIEDLIGKGSSGSDSGSEIDFNISEFED